MLIEKFIRLLMWLSRIEINAEIPTLQNISERLRYVD